MKTCFVLAASLLVLPLTARAAPPAGSSPVVVTEPAPQGAPLVVVEGQSQPTYAPTQGAYVPTTQNVVLAGNYDRMARGLRIERVGVLTATVGLVIEVIGLGIAAASTGGLFTGDHSATLNAGWAVTSAGLVVGGASGLVVSNQLKRFGIPRSRRGMAITSLVLSVVPFVQVVGYFLELVHLRKTQAIATNIQRVGFQVSPILSAAPGNTTVGSRFVLSF